MKETIEKFYEAFNRLDAEEMISYYHNDIMFEDPAFGKLQGDKAKNMWRMLCDSQKEDQFSVNFSKIEIIDSKVKAYWEAHYTFSKTGRKVHNRINASFTFKDNKIINHKDTFDLYKWSKQALGFSGFLIGWTPFFKSKLQAQTNQLLLRYEEKNIVND